MSYLQRLDNDDVSVVVSDLLVATADSTDPLLDGSVNEVLASLRRRLGLDVVFVSEFIDGRRVFRFVDSAAGAPPIQAGDSNPIEESFCQRVVDGRLPQRIPDVAALPRDADVPPLPFAVGAHLSTPIVLATGRTFGTLCCFSTQPSATLREKDLEVLKLCAKLVARKLELAESCGLKEPSADWAVEPKAVYRSEVWLLP